MTDLLRTQAAVRRVLIDGYFLEKPYGFGRFIFELCRALGRAETDLAFVVAVPSRLDHVALPRYRQLTWHPLPDANFILWEQIAIPRLARRLRCDVIHFPYNTRAVFTYAIPTVTTVHDLLFLHDRVGLSKPKDYVASRYAKLVFSASRRSDAVVSVSDTTRLALRERGIASQTVYNTVDGFVAEHAPKTMPLAGRRYVLHRGGYLAHRNTARVIEAFRAACATLGDIDLKVIGAPAGAERWGTGGDATIQFLPRVSDDELAALYAGSACVVATSLQEGFGLPIIEGFGFGVPVITSAIDPMAEVAGDAALLVDPCSIGDIADAIVSVVSDPALARSLVARGRDRMGVFASARVAEQMIDIYGRCVGASVRRREGAPDRLRKTVP